MLPPYTRILPYYDYNTCTHLWASLLKRQSTTRLFLIAAHSIKPLIIDSQVFKSPMYENGAECGKKKEVYRDSLPLNQRIAVHNKRRTVDLTFLFISSEGKDRS